MIGKEYATECCILKKEEADVRAWEKLELIRAADPAAGPIGMLYTGHGMDPAVLDVPVFGEQLVLLDLEAGSCCAFIRGEEGWHDSTLEVVSNRATRIAIDDAVGHDSRRAQIVLRNKLRNLQQQLPDSSALSRYSQLRKLQLFHAAPDAEIPPADVSYEMLGQLASKFPY